MTRAKCLSFLRTVMLVSGFVSLGRADPEPSEFSRGKEAWRQRQYAAAAQYLLRARAEPNGRSAETDYMLGTCGCRIPGRESWGKSYLTWALKTYALDPKSRAVVEKALEQCESGAPNEASGTSIDEIVAAQTPPGASASGKVMDLSNRLVASRPARQIRRLTEDEIKARRIPLGEAERLAEMIRTTSGLTNIKVCGDFAVVTDLAPAAANLGRACEGLLHYARFLTRQYALTTPDIYTVVYLIDDELELRELARRLHQLELDFRTLGYTVHDDGSIVARAQNLGLGTALHELFHLLARVDFGDIPTWFDEGVASIYEVSRRCGNDYYGITNWRAEVIRRSRLSSLRQLVLDSAYPFDDPSEHRFAEGPSPSSQRIAQDMATARYFAIYLQERKKLGTVFAGLRDRDPALAGDAGETALFLLEKELGKPIAEIQADFEKWYQATGLSLGYSSAKCARATLGPPAQPPQVAAFDPGPAAATSQPALTPVIATSASPLGPTPPPPPSAAPAPPPVEPTTGCACRAAGTARSTIGSWVVTLLLGVALGVRRALAGPATVIANRGVNVASLKLDENLPDSASAGSTRRFHRRVKNPQGAIGLRQKSSAELSESLRGSTARRACLSP